MPVKIVFPFSGDTVGGSHLAALKLIENLPSDRYAPLVILHGNGPLSAVLDERAIRFEVLTPPPPYVGMASSKLRQIGNLIRSTAIITPYLRGLNARIVHTNDARMHMAWTLPARLCGASMIWHQRTRHSPSALRRGIARFATHILGVSDYVIGTMPAEQKRRAIRIYDPIETSVSLANREEARQVILSEIGAPENACIVGFAGTLNEQKRPELFLETGRRLTDLCSRPVHLLLFGADRTGLGANLGQQAAQLGIAGQTHFMGYRSPLSQWLAGMDVFLAPGINEAFGNAIAEATLLGIPVVADDSGGNREIVTGPEYGHLVASGDANTMAAAAARILNKPEPDGLGSTSNPERSNRFTTAEHVGEILKIYDSILTGSSN